MNLCTVIKGVPVCNNNRDCMHDECEFYKRCTTCESTMRCPICDCRAHSGLCSNEAAIEAASGGDSR